MLTADDKPTIRYAILRRLDKETGVQVCAIKFVEGDDCIGVGVLAKLGNTIITSSQFQLPLVFEHSHLLNEIDEIAEHIKDARRDFFTAALPVSEVRKIAGTGLRGRWAQYG